MSGALLLALCVALSAAASLLLKIGVTAVNGQGMLAIVKHPVVLLGGFAYAATFALYALALQKVPLSLAQPVITAGACVVTAILSIVLLKEHLNAANWVGLVLVAAGVYLLFAGRG